MESRFGGLLPRRDHKKPRQVRAASYRTLAELADPHRVVSECPHHEAPLLLTASKDKPVLISALAAKPDVLLTLDARDFALLLSTEVYGVFVTTPRDFLIREGLG